MTFLEYYNQLTEDESLVIPGAVAGGAIGAIGGHGIGAIISGKKHKQMDLRRKLDQEVFRAVTATTNKEKKEARENVEKLSGEVNAAVKKARKSALIGAAIGGGLGAIGGGGLAGYTK